MDILKDGNKRIFNSDLQNHNFFKLLKLMISQCLIEKNTLEIARLTRLFSLCTAVCNLK